MRARALIFLTFLFAICWAGSGEAWNPEGNEVGVLRGFDSFTSAPGHVAPDGSGGVYVVWTSSVTAAFDDLEIRLQRLDANGLPVWPVDGILLAAAGGGRFVGAPQVAADGTGGALVTYFDNQTYGTETDFDLQVERIDASGNRLWGVGGVTLAPGSVVITEVPRVVGTGNGGALVAWIDVGPGWNVAFSQMLDASGNELGAPGGMDVFSMRPASELQLESDDSYAVITATLTETDDDVWISVYELGGASPWPIWQIGMGYSISEENGGKGVPDGNGGVYVAYYSDWNAVRELWVAGFNGDWPGAILTSDLGINQYYSAITVEPSTGDVMVAWTDNRTPEAGVDFDIYAQRFRRSGSPVWRANGVEVSEVSGQQQYPSIIDDGEGGAIVLWEDDRDSDVDVYAQRLAPGGWELWNPHGMPVLTRSGVQDLTRPVYASPGELRLGFTDSYTGSSSTDVRLQRLDTVHGWWGRPDAYLTGLADVPGDQGGVLSANWAPSDHDQVGMGLITHYSVWRSSAAIPRGLGPDSPLLVDASEVGLEFEGPAIRLDAASGYYWEYVGQQAAAALPGYQYAVPTTANDLVHAVQVLAHTGDAYVSFASNSLEATSTDDLAPAAPLALNAWRAGTDEVALEWQPGREDEPDFSRFELYRCEGSVFDLVSAQLIASPVDPAAIDPAAAITTGYVYAVAAIDVNANVSEMSEPFALPPATGVGAEPSLTQLMLRPSVPNPFSGSTLLRFSMPRPGDIEVTVYDLKGRAVRTLRRSAPAGWQELPLDSRDDRGHELASGIYLVRVRAGEQSAQGKIAIMR